MSRQRAIAIAHLFSISTHTPLLTPKISSFLSLIPQTRRLHCTSLAPVRTRIACWPQPLSILLVGTGRISSLRLSSVCAVLLRKEKNTDSVSLSIEREESISGSLALGLIDCVFCATPSAVCSCLASLRHFVALLRKKNPTTASSSTTRSSIARLQ